MWGMWGPCLAWGLASSQKRWWSPPSPPDMQANICAQTSQDSEKEFHSCAHLRLGCLALTPSPLHGMEVEGRGALPHTPCPPQECGAWLRSGMEEEAQWNRPRCRWHKVPLPKARRVCPWASSGQHRGLCAGALGSMCLAENWERSNPAVLHPQAAAPRPRWPLAVLLPGSVGVLLSGSSARPRLCTE